MTEPVVVAYGMGVDSTAMLIGWHARGLQVPDTVLFADTGSEKPETSAYLPVINEWLARVGYPLVTVLKRNSPRAGDTSLHGECHRKSVLPSLAYGGHAIVGLDVEYTDAAAIRNRYAALMAAQEQRGAPIAPRTAPVAQQSLFA